MCNELMRFESFEFGAIRVVTIENKDYFVGSDIAKALGYKRPSEAISTHCKGTVKYDIPTNGGTQLMLLIPEGDIYRLIVRSKLPSAEKFEKWVFDEVIPSVRNKGSYDIVETRIQEIEDSKERELSIAIYNFEKVLESNPQDWMTGIILSQKKSELEAYKQSQRLDNVEDKVKAITDSMAFQPTRASFAEKMRLLARKYFNKDMALAYREVYGYMKSVGGFDVMRRVKNAKQEIQEDRIAKGKSPYADSTLGAKVTGADIIDANNKWELASEAYRAIEAQMLSSVNRDRVVI